MAVGGEAGNAQYDPISKHVFGAVQTTNQVVDIDSATDQTVQRYDTRGCHPHGLLIDGDQHRAFVACQGNNKLIVMDMPSMKVTTTLEVGSGPDVLALDAPLHLVYVAAKMDRWPSLAPRAAECSVLHSSQRVQTRIP